MMRGRVIAVMVGLVLGGCALHAPAAFAATPAGQWSFDEGNGTTAADAAGAHPATLAGGAAWTTGVIGPGALAVNGSNAYADTGAPVIDTSRSFSVSAWVKLANLNGYQTALSIDGSQVSGFYLGLRGDTNRFAFARLASDAPQSAAVAGATSDPVANRWYLLTGVYDATAGTLSLYVDGSLQSTVTAPSGWQATGDLVIGRGKYGGGPVDWVSGAIDDVRAYQSALGPDDISPLVDAGSWRFDEGTGTTAADDSPNHDTLTLNSGASWTAGAVGPSSLLFNGTSGAAEASGPVIDTSQGFSVAAWVRVDSATGTRTAVSVDGNQISGFFLQRRADGTFAFVRIATDAPGGAVAAASTATALVGQWYHLVGVYDSGANTLTLYVDGIKQQTVTAPPAWKATGHLAVGRGKYNGAPTDFWAGAIDDVRVFPTAIEDSAAAALAASGVWHFDEGTGTTAGDSSPAHDAGTLSQGAGWTAGVSGHAVSLDGASSVDMGAAPSLNLGTGSATIAGWVRTTTDGTIAAKGAGYSLAITGGRLHAKLGSIDVTSTTGGLADGDFHYVALTVDRATQTVALYADGDPLGVTSAGCGTGTDISACATAAGDSPADFVAGQGLTGALDDLQVLRFALTADQIAAQDGSNTIAIDATDVRAHTRPTEYGSILEDINHSVEGGLYAELVRNRAMQESGSGPVPYWTLVTGGGATGSFSVDTTHPLNSALTKSLHLHADSLPAGGRVAASNAGFWGVDVAPSTTYTGTLFAEAPAGFSGRLRVTLEKPDGTVLAGTTIAGIGTTYAKHDYTLQTPAGIAESTDNRIVVAMESDTALTDQDVYLTYISLFPPTYKNHGLRIDLMQKLAALHLGLFRIPGGNYLEGNTLDTRFDWEKTVGNPWERPGHMNTAWGYWSTDGMGILQYLEMAEDLGAQPDLAVFAGYTLNGQDVSQSDYQQYIDSALDEIQYAIGDTSTKWGAQRAADGHPAPFDLHYVEIGNEDWFDPGHSYSWRFTLMAEAIKNRYPQLKLISTVGGYQGGGASSASYGTATPDATDDHFYPSAQWFNDNSTLYDRADRNGPRVLVGEYGAAEGNPTGTLNAAVGEAAFLTGLERNSDVVIGSMYAPVLVNENAVNWAPDLIGFDAGSSYGSPSYEVQKLFAENTGADVVASSVTGQGGLKQVVTKTTDGGRTTFYVKVVNFGAQQQSARLQFTGVSRFDEGTQTVLTGDPAARNSLTDPTLIAPAGKALSHIALSPRFSFPGKSVTVIKLVGALGDPAGPATSAPPQTADVGGDVPATLGITVGAAPDFGPFVPGVARDYTAATTVTTTSSAGDATLSVADPSSDNPGHLVNGAFALPQPLRADGQPLPAAVKTYTGPVADDAATVEFEQSVGATDALRTGRYAKPVTFTLSTTSP